jgi:branched-chain amino acid transport system ATP-binding protein
MSLLQLEGVSRSFGGVRAVEDVSTTVGEGELFGVIGPNGAGKTTLFNLITGLIPPDRGRVLLGGEDITRKPPSASPRSASPAPTRRSACSRP